MIRSKIGETEKIPSQEIEEITIMPKLIIFIGLNGGFSSSKGIQRMCINPSP
jgi:hypothetical protein